MFMLHNDNNIDSTLSGSNFWNWSILNPVKWVMSVAWNALPSRPNKETVKKFAIGVVGMSIFYIILPDHLRDQIHDAVNKLRSRLWSNCLEILHKFIMQKTTLFQLFRENPETLGAFGTVCVTTGGSIGTYGYILLERAKNAKRPADNSVAFEDNPVFTELITNLLTDNAGLKKTLSTLTKEYDAVKNNVFHKDIEIEELRAKLQATQELLAYNELAIAQAHQEQARKDQMKCQRNPNRNGGSLDVSNARIMPTTPSIDTNTISQSGQFVLNPSQNGFFSESKSQKQNQNNTIYLIQSSEQPEPQQRRLNNTNNTNR